MRIEVVKRYYGDRSVVTLVNAETRKFVAQLGPFDNVFTSQRLTEAVNLYADLMDNGLLVPVLNALEKRKSEQPK